MHFNFKILPAFIVYIFFYSNANADIDELYHLSIGTNLETYNSTISINSNSQSTGGSIDFEDDLGYDNKASTLWLSGWYRVGDAHRIQLTYSPLKRSAQATSKKDIVIDGATIKAGAEFLSTTKTEILDFSYIYSAYQSAEFEVGISAGLYWLFTSSEFLAAGEIQGENEDEPSFRSDYSSEQNIQAPMPLLGLSAIYEITPQWRVHAAVRYLSILLNDVDGKIASSELGAEYYFSKNWGAGLSLNYFDMDINVIRLRADTNFGWSHNGLQIYATFKY